MRAIVSIALVGAVAFVASPALAQGDGHGDPGPFTPNNGAGSYEMSCSTSFSAPPDWVPSGSLPYIDEGSIVLVRCFGDPNLGTTLTAGSVTVGFGNGATASPTTNCLMNGEFNAAAGRYAMTCQVVDINNLLRLELERGARVSMSLGSGAQLRTKQADGDIGGMDNPRAIAWWSLIGQPPPWPEMYPWGAEPPRVGNPPRLRCNVEQRVDPFGNVRADFNVSIDNVTIDSEGYADVVESTQWGFEWNADPEDIGTGEPSSPSWWEDREPLADGRVQRNVLVPEHPLGATWLATARVVMTFEQPYDEFQDLTYVDVDQSSPGFYLALGHYVIANQFGDAEFWHGEEGEYSTIGGLPYDWLVPGPPAAYTVEAIAGGQPDTIQYAGIEARCSVPVDPSRAGTPGGDIIVDVAPTPDGQGSFPPGAPGGPEPIGPGNPPDEGCSIPDGWSMLNPIAWGQAAACAVGGLLDGLWDFLDGLLEQLAGLFIPEEGFLDGIWVRLQDALAESGVGSLGDPFVSIGAASTAFLDEAGSGGSCSGPVTVLPLPGGVEPIEARFFEACDGVQATAASWSKRLLSASILFGAAMKAATIVAGSLGLVLPWSGPKE